VPAFYIVQRANSVPTARSFAPPALANCS
jgi:hypothetical protein